MARKEPPSSDYSAGWVTGVTELYEWLHDRDRVTGGDLDDFLKTVQ